jgi:hypothetical protein
MLVWSCAVCCALYLASSNPEPSRPGRPGSVLPAGHESCCDALLHPGRLRCRMRDDRMEYSIGRTPPNQLSTLPGPAKERGQLPTSSTNHADHCQTFESKHTCLANRCLQWRNTEGDIHGNAVGNDGMCRTCRERIRCLSLAAGKQSFACHWLWEEYPRPLIGPVPSLLAFDVGNH